MSTRRPTRISIPLGIIAALIFFHAVGWAQPIERALVRALGSITKPIGLRSSRATRWLRNITADLDVENEKLRERVAILEGESAQLHTQVAEIDALRAALGAQKRQGARTVVARAIGREAATGRSVLVLDQGSRDGVAAGDPVTTDKGFLIGTLTSVKDATSFALLITDETSRVAAGITEHPETIGVLEGGHGLTARLTLIPPEAALENGNTVKTTAGSPRVPAGIPIGRVEEVRKDAHTPFQSALIAPFAALTHAEFYIILHP